MGRAGLHVGGRNTGAKIQEALVEKKITNDPLKGKEGRFAEEVSRPCQEKTKATKMSIKEKVWPWGGAYLVFPWQITK